MLSETEIRTALDTAIDVYTSVTKQYKANPFRAGGYAEVAYYTALTGTLLAVLGEVPMSDIIPEAF